MSPRERFNRLYNRIMTAAQSGDEATVSRFTPMALMAYAQLDTIDADAEKEAGHAQGPASEPVNKSLGGRLSRSVMTA